MCLKKNYLIKFSGDNTDLVWTTPKLNRLKKNTAIDVVVPFSHEAVCVIDGVADKVWGPGRYSLAAKIDYKEQDLKFYFINKTITIPILWGTPNPIDLQDPVFEMGVRFGANGGIKLNIADSKTFLYKVVGSSTGIDSEGIAEFFRQKIVLLFTSLLAKNMASLGLSYFELPAQLQAMSAILQEAIAPDFEQYGLAVADFTIDFIKISEDTLKKFTSDQELVRRLKVRETTFEKLRSEARTDRDTEVQHEVALIKAFGQLARDVKPEVSDVYIENNDYSVNTIRPRK